MIHGRSDGGYIGYIYTLPKSVLVNFYGVKMTSKRQLNMNIKVLYLHKKAFIPPKQISGYAPRMIKSCYVQNHDSLMHLVERTV